MAKSRRLSADLPTSLGQFDAARPKFVPWLVARGSAVLEITNPFEVIRFIGPKNVCIVYRNGKNQITNWSNGADIAYRAFLSGDPWRGHQKIERARKTEQMIQTLAARDGWGCLYCGQDTALETASIEHIIPITSGGPDHPANMTLTHAKCNASAGHKSAREKFEMAFAMRERKAVDA